MRSITKIYKKIYEIYTKDIAKKYQPAGPAGPARSGGARRTGPGRAARRLRRRPLAADPAAAWYFVLVSVWGNVVTIIRILIKYILCMALGHIGPCGATIPKNLKIYTRNISKYIQNTRRKPAARGLAGLPPPGRRLVFCTYLIYGTYLYIYIYIYIYLDIFWYLFA